MTNYLSIRTVRRSPIKLSWQRKNDKENYLPIIKKAKIFEGLAEGNILSKLACLKAFVRTYKKGAMIFREGDSADFIGVILYGEVQAQKVDYGGNINIITKLFPSGMIAAVASYSTQKRLPFDIVAACDTGVLCLSNESLLHTCSNACDFHARVIENMLGIIADKNIELSLKIDILTKRTIREKILSYLYSQSNKVKNSSFSISLSRRQMAEYLSVNRSALSRELSQMQQEGIIEFDDNYFKLK